MSDCQGCGRPCACDATCGPADHPVMSTCEHCRVLCEQCGWEVTDEILAETPECPHGWTSLEGMTIADIKAVFASGAPELSIDLPGE